MTAPKKQSPLSGNAAWLNALLVVALLPGCSRQFWRKQADMDVYDAVGQKLNDPRWAVPRVDVTADPRSRFFDPYDLDRPPLPPDDPAAHTLMHWVDGWQGYKGWHQFGDLVSVENPQWMANFGVSAEQVDPLTGQPQGPVPAIQKMTLQQAVELSLIHSRDYQTQIENVYLAALNVTFQRFQFGVRYLGSFGEPGASLTTAITPDGIAANDGATGSAQAGVSQLLPTGAQWMIELTNNTLWLFSGPNQTNTASTLSYSLTQPLWMGAGRKVVLESLTLAERQLYYAIRDLARFRQQLFTDVVATSQATSFLGLLQSRQQILNLEENLRRLQQQVLILTAAAERGRELPSAPLLDNAGQLIPLDQAPEITIPAELQGLLVYNREDRRLRWRPATEMTEVQAQQLLALSDALAFQSAANALIRQVRVPVTSLDVLTILATYNNTENQLRNLERSYQDSLDQYKIQLGLPPTIPMTLDVTLLQQFELIDPAILELEREVDQGFSQSYAGSSPAEVVFEAGRLPETVLDPQQLIALSAEFSELVRRVRLDALERVRDEMATVAGIVPGRLPQLQEDERQRLTVDFDRDQRIFGGLEKDYEVIAEEAAAIEAALAAPRIDQDSLHSLRTRIKIGQQTLVRLVRSLSVTEVGLRVEMIELDPFDQTEEECLDTALANRVDLMNARAQVMDSRRQVEIAANQLQAALALVADGTIGSTNRTNPFSFNGDNSTIRFGVRFKAPLDQITERNNYRTALVNYQREKRAYMLFEDGVKQQVRRALRGLRVQKRNLETARGAVRRAALQYDALNEQTNDPAKATQAANSATGGLQGQIVLTALNTILSAQNQLVSTWMDYERNRLNIYRDMGIMEIGPDGLWTDPFYHRANYELSSPTQPEVPVPPAPGLGPDAGGADGSGLSGGLRVPAGMD